MGALLRSNAQIVQTSKTNSLNAYSLNNLNSYRHFK
jgi:hypothetical protein